MTARQEQPNERQASVAELRSQLEAWSKRLDGLVANCIRAGAYKLDAYRVRVDKLRTRQLSVQDRLNEFEHSPASGSWDAFRETLVADWTALEAGFRDLTRSPQPGA